jgi:hypothetical protein
MRISKQAFFLLLPLLFLNCTSNTKKSITTIADSNNQNELNKQSLPVNITSKNSSDSLQSFAKKKLELNELHIKKDTLEIVSTMAFLYYPFGKFKTFDSLRHSLIIFKDSLEVDSLNNKLHRMTFKNSFLKFYFDDDKKAFEIVSGEIRDQNIILLNNIRVGITKIDFINIFFNGIASKQVEGIKIIKIISGLEGIIHYYNFNNDILTSIKLDTDYLLNKN